MRTRSSLYESRGRGGGGKGGGLRAAAPARCSMAALSSSRPGQRQRVLPPP
jgi:hypothetical protein